MDRGTRTVARRRTRGPLLPGHAPHGRWRGTPLPSVAWVQTRRSTECPPAPEPPRPSAGREPELLLWVDLPADILGLVVGRLPRVDDRTRLRSVCRAWRTTARVHWQPPPPLPLLVLSDFSFSAFCADGAMTGVRRIPWVAASVSSVTLPCTRERSAWSARSPRTSLSDISEDDSGLMVSGVKRCVTQLPEVKDSYGQRWNIVEWHGKLLLVVIYLGPEGWHNICKIGVFEVDLGTNPFRFTEINSLDGAICCGNSRRQPSGTRWQPDESNMALPF